MRTSISHWQHKPAADGSGHDIDISTSTEVATRVARQSAAVAAAALAPLSQSRRRRQAIYAESIINFAMHTIFFAYTMVIWFGELLLLPPNEIDWCTSAQMGYPNVKRYDNPDYNNNPCYKERPWQLLYMSQMETNFARRMFSSVLMGAAIGFERKASDRPAGIRTMSLVSLGACLFSMCGQLAFRSSTMGFDAARVSAAIPSGVGFLGAGLIWKGTVGAKGTPDERHEVHGLTTAASVWLSASVGVGVGGRLYIVSAYCVALVILVLRLGPRLYFQEDASSYCGDDDNDDDLSSSSESSDSFSFVGTDFRYILPDGDPAAAGNIDNSEGEHRGRGVNEMIVKDKAGGDVTVTTQEASTGPSLMLNTLTGTVRLKRSSSCPSFCVATDDGDVATTATSYRRSDSAKIEELLSSTRSEGMLVDARLLRSSSSNGINYPPSRWHEHRQTQQRRLSRSTTTGNRSSTKNPKRRYRGVSFHN